MARKERQTTELVKNQLVNNDDALVKKSVPDTVFEQFPEDIIYYDFFAALHLLEKQHKTRFGESKTPQDDPILLGQSPHMGFVPTALHDISTLKITGHKRLNIFFFGLFGPNGPLPYHLTEAVYAKLPRKKRPAAQDFFNIFHHRLISLFYRAWANKEPIAQLDREGEDRFQFYLNSIAGYGLPTLKNRDTFNDYSKAHFAGYLSGKIRHKEGLENIIQQLYGIQSTIIEFVGEWLSIGKEHQCSLKEPCYAPKLGVNTSLGKNSWQSQYKFQIQLGPLSLAEYEAALPNKNKLKLINETIKNYMRDEIQWEIILLLKKSEIPITTIGTYGRLGWTSWLKTKPANDTASLQHDEVVSNIRLHCDQII
ncbi:MAG: type VI secretion system baseplate subunit TssG [Cocleimonas sp.]|nr:type VI secretion system baseplate subunit TssG [Cocleimonas sp.]